MTSKADLRRYDRLQRVGCVACSIDGHYSPGDVHHLVDRGYRKHSGGNKSTMVLCVWHHRGHVPDGYTIATATEEFGPSLKHQSKAFANRYGTQRELLERVNKAIGATA